MDFFKTSTNNLLEYGVAAGVEHLATLSVVGTQRLSDSPYFRAKIYSRKAHQGILYPLLDCPSDTVLRVR